MRTTECNNHAICDTGRLVFLTFLQHGDWCILLEAAWQRDVPSFPFGERAAIVPSASAFSRTGRFFRSRINIVGRMVARPKRAA
jgi:hypothetical protein